MKAKSGELSELRKQTDSTIEELKIMLAERDTQIRIQNEEIEDLKKLHDEISDLKDSR